ncbi:MauE/DoxX family redox-associated membrane protein [Sinosporangium siamense]|uniref:MauE/DoxX family redox-associated membrane protein n=1 Tax=Sinosporangium siamense TaxID=1367973 RepID=UPI0035EA0CD6
MVFAQTAVGVVLFVAGVSKVVSKQSVLPFLVALTVPRGVAEFAAKAVAPLEIACGVLLLAGLGSTPAYLAAALCTAFAVLLLLAYRFGVTESCSCFGSLDRSEFGIVVVFRGVALAVAALWSAALVTRAGPAESSLAWDRATAEAVTVGAAAAGVYVLGFMLLAEVVQFEGHRRRLRHQHAAKAETGGEHL